MFGNLKTWLRGTLHRKHKPGDLAEVTYRVDRRLREEQLVGFVLRRAAHGEPLPYNRPASSTGAEGPALGPSVRSIVSGCRASAQSRQWVDLCVGGGLLPRADAGRHRAPRCSARYEICASRDPESHDGGKSNRTPGSEASEQGYQRRAARRFAGFKLQARAALRNPCQLCGSLDHGSLQCGCLPPHWRVWHRREKIEP